MEKLILNNQTPLNIESGSSLLDIRVLSDTKSDMVSTWDMLTEDNLRNIEIRNEDGTVIGIYDNVLLESETSTIRLDGSILTSFHLREKTEVELLRERIEQLEFRQEVHDAAISDLGVAISDVVEEGGLA